MTKGYQIKYPVFEKDGKNYKFCTACKQDREYPVSFWKDGNKRSHHCIQCEKLERKYNPKVQYHNSKAQAKNRGFKTYLTFQEWSELRAKKNCACCGQTFDQATTSTNNPNQLTIDRVNNDVGYDVFDNCRAICRKCNDQKTSNSIQSLETILRYMKENIQ